MADAAVVETPVADVKGKPAETRPAEKPAEQKPSEQKPAEQKPAEQKPAEEQPAAAKPETPAADPARKDGTPTEEKPKPPEKYALKVPEGSRVDADDLAEIEQLAKTAGWSNDDAQAALEELHTHLTARADRWLTETKANRDYGGDHLEESQRLAKVAINRLRPDGHPRRESFLRFLNKGGAGNHLEVVAFLADLGKAMSEDAPGRGGVSGGAAPKGLAERLYPNAPVSRADDLYGGT